MDRADGSRNFAGNPDICSQAKQRATIKWLLSKVYNNRIPENVIEPFYKDHDNQEHLKPPLVHSLASSELYCMALGNIYSDPNYHNLNHWGVIQALNKKGVTVNDPSVTETVLIQTTPLKLSAHMTIMEAVMTLYAKEVATPNRVMAAIQRLNHVPHRTPIVMPEDHERAILLWVNRIVEALKQRISSSQTENLSVPDIAPVNDFHEMSDGAAIAALISFYCPDELPWQFITVSKAPTSSDCIKNFSVINEFCDNSLPFCIFHMRPQDVYYIRGSMKANLIAFFADLFNVLEIHPAKCVSFNQGSNDLAEAYPRNSHGVAHKRLLPQAISVIPDLRSNLDSHSTGFTGMAHNNSVKKVSNTITPQPPPDGKKISRSNGDEQFVVHRNRSVLTLNSMLNASNGDANNDVAAGKPTHWEDTRKQSYAGRRSRRNSFSEDSQLTVENFGGSQDNLHFLGRNPDKEPAIHVARKDSISKITNSHSQENDSSGVQNLLQHSNASFAVNLLQHTNTSSGAQNALQHSNTSPAMSRVSSDASNNSQGLQRMLYDSFDDVESVVQPPMSTLKRSLSYVDTTQPVHPSSTTTWLQQSSSSAAHSEHGDDSESDGSVMSSQLLNIKLKLEEKRRQIENDKRKMESLMNRQRQQVGKAAFFQAVTRSKNGGRNLQSPDSNYSRMMFDGNISPSSVKTAQQSFTYQDNGIESKWSDRMSPYTDDRKTPDLDHINTEDLNTLSKMHSNYQDMHADLQCLTNQQNQMQHNSLQSEMMQHYPGIQSLQQVYQNSHSIHQPQNFLINRQQSNNCVMPNGQMIQHIEHNNTDNGQQWHSLMNHNQPSLPVYNNYNQPQHPQYQHQQLYVNQRPIPNTLQNSSTIDNDYIPQESYEQIMQPNKETQSQQFFLHNNQQQHLQQQQQQQQQQKFRKSWDVTPSQQAHTFAQESQNVWNGSRTIPKSSQPSSLSGSPRQKSEFTLLNRSGVKTSPSSPVPPPRRNSNHVVSHSQLPTPSIDDMQPQSISFIGNDSKKSDLDLSESLNRIHITSGHRTYRIPSPTRTHMPINRNSFSDNNSSISQTSHDTSANTSDKGFYVSFEETDTPKRPKPPLRTKKIISKDRNLTQVLNNSVSLNNLDISPRNCNSSASNFSKSKEFSSPVKSVSESTVLQNLNNETNHPKSSTPTGVELIIENSNPDPNAIDEMEKKKERILLLSLQRRQQQEEIKNKKEIEAQKRKEKEKEKEEMKLRKKEEEKQRRAMILEQYRIKKAIEEAEREGKTVDKELLNSLKTNNNHTMGGPPRLRSKMQSGRPRPKTIHVDRSDAHDGTLTPSRGKKGSITNLATLNSQIRRDYYRGSQDCLAETRRTSTSSLYSDVTDEGKLNTPRNLDRHGSYKNSRDSSLDRTKRKTNFGYYNSAPRKSSSLMNLYGGSSCDQDSLLYRCGDTDSGLGRATPPRRAASPSGPGSLPIRRKFDDAASESGGSDYSGPRLYKQPVTKSNRGIILNAVEYCVFPGVVNREAKKRVLEEINRSEARHFLVLFRDTGCQFRALYLYYPETEEVAKLYGTGPRIVTDRMFDRFFKYNSGGKCFSQVHTKHLTVTIDAFTIHNSLWQGKKVNYPNKKDMTLVV